MRARFERVEIEPKDREQYGRVVTLAFFMVSTSASMKNWFWLGTHGSMNGIATLGTAITDTGWRDGQGKRKRDCGQEIILSVVGLEA